jgi:hypothetical protein
MRKVAPLLTCGLPALRRAPVRASAWAPRLASLLLLTALWLVPRGARAETRRFALAMMHFNVQYVAGGLAGFTPDPKYDRDEKQVEDQIVVQSLEPVLDIFLAHPSWGQDVEMQGYMLEVIAERHPRVLEKLRKLANSGQIDVVSFHYSDQLFLAYPRVDWERSAARNKQTFERLGVRLSGTVFCQEGQAGLGMAGAMRANGYDVLVWPKNLFSYQHEGLAPAPLYAMGEVAMITSNDAKVTSGSDAIEMTWTFVDDGELLATNDMNPYLAESFVRQEKSVREYEDKLAKLEAQGYAIAPVAKYVAALRQLVTGATPPPLLDGTWQPKTTDSVLRWMGGKGIWLNDERDNDVRTLGAIAHREVLAAETIAKRSAIDASAELDAAWRLLALGQVTDATGINPFRGEMEYGIAHFTEALRVAREVIRRAKRALGETGMVAIDTASGEVSRDVAPAEPKAAAQGPFEPRITTDARTTRVKWHELEPGHWTLSLELDPGDGAVTLGIPGAMGDIVYTPGLTSGPVHAPRSAFTFDHFYLPLHDGLIGLGDGLWLVKDQAFMHLAARVEPKHGDVSFLEEAPPAGERQVWKVHVVRGDEATAARLAARINVTPKVWR